MKSKQAMFISSNMRSFQFQYFDDCYQELLSIGLKPGRSHVAVTQKYSRKWLLNKYEKLANICHTVFVYAKLPFVNGEPH